MILTRRDLLAGAAVGAVARAAAAPFPLGICSETFGNVPFAACCRLAKSTGYTGVEIDPANLSGDPAALTASERREHRRSMRGARIQFVGLHSFLKAPAGLHLTTPDSATRERSWDYFAKLIDLTADLGDGAVMVLGSSKQRSAIEGATPQSATSRLTEGLARMAPLAEKRGVTILLEPLSPRFSNTVNTLGESVAIVKSIGNPAVRTMFDTHNTDAEKESASALIRRYSSYIRHVHLNEMDGRRPGAGDYPFAALLAALRANAYRGWLSVEAFDFKPDGVTVAKEAASFIRSLPI